ncbi:MAG: hypothetical protein R6X02_13835 [Enhygromyxa sp.]
MSSRQHLELPEQGEPLEPRPEPVTLTDLDVIDPILEAEVVAAIEAGEHRRTLAAARELARQSTPRERDEWNDLAELVALLQAGDCVAAYLWTRGVRRVPAAVADVLFAHLSEALERRGELALAWAAAGQLLLDESGPDRRARIEAKLDRGGPSLASEVSSRARDFFVGPAQAGDRLAQRGLARALTELDELADALTWIRRALTAERFDFDARMLETEILALRAIELDDKRELFAALLKAADDFHDRPEPLVDLAEYVQYDDPEWAIEHLRQAQEREYDEFALLTLLDLLDQTQRHEQIIREIEQALADPDAVTLVEDQLRARLSAAQTKLAGGGALAPAKTHPPALTGGPVVSMIVLATAVALIVLGIVLILIL